MDFTGNSKNFIPSHCYVFPDVEPTAPPWTPDQTLHRNASKNATEEKEAGSHASFAFDDEPEPSAPPIELMDRVSGYEDASFFAIEVPPPIIPSRPKPEDGPQRTPFTSTPQLTEQEARQALLKYASSHCCYGKAAARNMAIVKMEHSSAFHYTLETFCEKRQTAWSYDPYLGGAVDGPSSGSAPGPWEVYAAPPPNFQNHVTSLEVPHTASVKTCHTCGGVGRKRCFTCSGNGMEQCSYCHGDGQKTNLEGESERCFHCHGTGKIKCFKCNGDGVTVCRSCTGTGNIRCFIKLTVSWTNHVDDYVVGHSCVPDEKLKLVSGQVVFDEQCPVVWPINHFPDTTINMASVQLVQKHASAFPSEKIVMQRHRVRVIPVSTVHYNWSSHVGKFSVYGFERKVYAPDYPQTCCCGCSIL